MIMQKHNRKINNHNFFLGDNCTEIVNEYTYLGLKLTANNKFTMATKQLSEKTQHALFKIRKNINSNRLNPKVAMKIFDGIVSPILLYNSEIWGAYGNIDFKKWDNTPTEKTHLKFCKLYLGVNRNASNVASRGELGEFPLLISILKRLFTYTNHIIKLPDSTIAKQAFSLSKRLHQADKNSFYTNIINIIKKFYPDIEEHIDVENFMQNHTINDLTKSIKNQYTSSWKQQINNSTKLLSTFKEHYN